MRNNFILLIFFPIFHFCQININANLLETNFGGDSSPKDIVKIDNKLFFTAISYDQTYTQKRKVFIKQNLISDATSIIINNNQYNSVSIVGNLGSIIYILVDINYSADKQLWRTDGTASGTYLIKNIDNTAGTDITKFSFSDDKFFFTYYNANSHHLWSSDGTSANTNQIGSFSAITNLTFINGNAVFSTQNNSGNTVIYKTNGTAIGTNIITSFPLGVSAIYQIVSSGSFYYFLKNQNGSSQFCKSDLSGNITVIKDLQQYETNLKAAVINNKLIFSTREFLNGSNKNVIYSYNETDNSTTMITNYPSVENIISFKGKVYFNIVDLNNTYALISSDGTISGTQNLSNVYNIPDIYMLQKSRDLQYLILKSLSDTYLVDGISLLPKKIIKESPSFEFNDLLDFTLYDSFHVIFSGKNNKNGNELFVQTSNISTLLEDINHFGGTSFVSPIELNNKLIFFGNDFQSGQYEPAISDGTMSGTKIIKDLNPGGFGSTHYSDNPTFFKNGNKLFFRCANGLAANEPCVTDGTEIGTKLIKKLNIYSVGSLAEDPYYMHLNDNEVLFAADGNTNNLGGDYNLWKTDGTEAGTVFVHSVYPSKGMYDHKVSSAKINNFVYFTGQTDLNDNPAIWKTDGTTVGTQFIQSFPIPSSNYFYFPRIIAQYNNKFFISASHWSTTPKLYVYDVTTNTATLLQTLPTGSLQINMNKMYFIGIEKIITINMDNLQSSENNYNPGANTISNSVQYKQCADNLFIYNSNSATNTTKFFLMNNFINQPITLNHANITASECIDNRLLYVARTSGSTLEKLIKITDGTTFTDINLFYENQNVLLTNFVYNDVSSIFKVQDKLFFYGSANLLNMAGSELYAINDWNQFLNTNEQISSNQKPIDIITVYPIPSSDFISLKSDKKIILKSVSAFDMSGKKVVLKNIDKEKFDIRDLVDGVYIIEIKTDIGTFSKKFIKK